ncbi:MAG: P-II family nitrogen regulator [Vicinamibacterales bacterium]
MKLIKAIVRSDKLETVTDVLSRVTVSGLTISEVRGHGHQQDSRGIYRGHEYTISLLPKVEIETVVPDDAVDEAVRAIIGAACTREVGDGRVFVLPVEGSYRIRTSESMRDDATAPTHKR